MACRISQQLGCTAVAHSIRTIAICALVIGAIPCLGQQARKHDGTTVMSADQCIDVLLVPKKAVDDAHHEVMNICSVPVQVAYCHPPSASRGKDGQCGAQYAGQYFSLFTLLKPGEAFGNHFALPMDVPVHFGACFGRRLHHGNPRGDYTCPDQADSKQVFHFRSLGG